MVRQALPRQRLAGAEHLSNGYRNVNLKLRFESSSELFVLRIYEHDPSLCRKEVDLLGLVAGSVPVPDLIFSAPDGFEELPPYVLMKFIAGLSFRELWRGGDIQAIAQASFSAGQTLAAISRFRFSKPGWIQPGPNVGSPLIEGPDPIPRFIDLCLASENLSSRMPPELMDQVRELVWTSRKALAASAEETRLVHGDFNKRNLLVRQEAGQWKVAAVLDWEFAVSGSPLIDTGNFLRYETQHLPTAEPHFSAGFVNGGGVLPGGWKRLAKLIDLAAVCEILTHHGLPVGLEEELLEIVRDTAADEW
jgi:aminoglycoside phosphotransferase (APT) family kinase protein